MSRSPPSHRSACCLLLLTVWSPFLLCDDGSDRLKVVLPGAFLNACVRFCHIYNKTIPNSRSSYHGAPPSPGKICLQCLIINTTRFADNCGYSIGGSATVGQCECALEVRSTTMSGALMDAFLVCSFHGTAAPKSRIEGTTAHTAKRPPQIECDAMRCRRNADGAGAAERE
jgi:hypothetical protein